MQWDKQEKMFLNKRTGSAKVRSEEMRYRFAMIDNELRPNPYSPLFKIVRAADTAISHF